MPRGLALRSAPHRRGAQPPHPLSGPTASPPTYPPSFLPLLALLCASLLALALLRASPAPPLRAPSPAPPPSPAPTPSPTPAPLYPRVAVCVTGSLRTFLLPPVYSSIHRTLLAPVQRLGGKADVFLLLTSRHAPHPDGRGDTVDAECSHHPLAAAVELLAPAHVELWPNASSCAGGVRFFNESCCGADSPGSLKAVTYMQSGWVAKCFARAEAHALESGFAYTHFVRTRSDLYLGAAPPDWAWHPGHAAQRLWSAHKYAPGSDMFFIFSAALYQRWWKGMWRERSCASLEEGRSWEYQLFTGLQEMEPDQRPGRCEDSRQLGGGGDCVDPLLEDIEPPRAEGGGGPIIVHKLLSLRHILVRSSSFLACWSVGFWCRPKVCVPPPPPLYPPPPL